MIRATKFDKIQISTTFLVPGIFYFPLDWTPVAACASPGNSAHLMVHPCLADPPADLSMRFLAVSYMSHARAVYIRGVAHSAEFEFGSLFVLGRKR